jgi:glyoxylase-like metal-dependent hydrolase (beta-lactamase superfamily II)
MRIIIGRSSPEQSNVYGHRSALDGGRPELVGEESMFKARLIAGTVAAVTLMTGAGAQSTFTLKVHTGRGQIGYDVNSTLVIGERDLLVIDPQFSLSEAHKLAAAILETKKRLVTIYSTHAHPDHLFGLAVLKQAFPDAKIVALPATVNAARTGWPARQKFWVATYGNNIPGPEPVLPEELAAPVLTLEGEEFPITGGVQGADGPGNSFVWIPSLKTVVTGDIVFDRVYFGVPREAARENWRKTIDQISSPTWSFPAMKVQEPPETCARSNS